jgi:membrane protease subunit HflC
MKPIHLLILAAVFVGFVLLVSSVYVVGEQEQVIITQFGRPVGQAINSDPNKSEAGLHFKTPFVQEVNRFEKRILEWDGPSTAMSTREKQTIVVNAFARWRISDPLKYFQSVRDERSALSRLNDTVGTAVRSVIAAHDLVEVIRTDKNRTVPKSSATAVAPVAPSAPAPSAPVSSIIATATPGTLPKIKIGRVELERQVLEQAVIAMSDRFGIKLLDVRFKRINYNPSVADKIHERMISERTQIAESFRSDGAGEAAKIDGRRGKELQQIESEAYRTVQELKGKADAEATSIYALAYNTGPAAADFYQFLKTLETYKTTLGQDSTLIMTTDSDFFKYLKRTDPKAALAPAPAPAPVPAPPTP